MTAPGAGRGATPERIRECLDAVLWATQGAGPAVTHVTLPLAVADDIARVLELAARPSPRDGRAAGEVERLVRERDDARASNRKLHRDIQQREREFVRSTRAEQRRVWLYLGHPKSVSAHTWARREFAKQLDEAEARATAAESRAEAAEREAAKLIAAASYAPRPDQPSGVYGPNDIQRAFKAGWSQHAQMVAAQLGAAAREGGAVCRDFRQTGDGTTPSAEDGHGRG